MKQRVIVIISDYYTHIHKGKQNILEVKVVLFHNILHGFSKTTTYINNNTGILLLNIVHYKIIIK